LKIDASPFAMLFDNLIKFTFNGEVQGGEINDGEISIDTETQKKRIRIGSIEDIRLGAERFLLGIVGLDLQGTLEGSFDVELGKTASHIQDGSIDLTLNSAKVIKPSFKGPGSMGLIGLTDTDIGDLRIRAVVKPLKELPGAGGRRNRKSKSSLVIHFEELNCDSEELAFQVEKKSAIHFDPTRSIGDATLDLHFAVYVKDAYLEKEGENFEGSVGKHNKIISQAARMRLIPKLARVYRKGVFGVMCTGKMSKPDCDFKRTSLKFEKTTPRKEKTNVARKDRNKRASKKPSTRRPPARSETSSSATTRRASTPPPRTVNARADRTSGVSGRSPRTNTISPSRIERPARKAASSSRTIMPGAASVTDTLRRKAPPIREPLGEDNGEEEDSEEEESDDSDNEDDDEDGDEDEDDDDDDEDDDDEEEEE